MDYYELYQELKKETREGEKAYMGTTFKNEIVHTLVLNLEHFFIEMRKAVCEGKGFRLVLQYKPEVERAPFVMYVDKDEDDSKAESEENQD